jgi:ABC-2 type transport system ATP-binding protein
MINADNSPVIEALGLTKVFRIFRRRAGIGGAVVNLFKREYENIRAVDGVSFAIEPGEILGYIGPNGAGKSTTIKMLCGIIRPTEGTCRVLGRDPHRQRVANAREVGVMFGQRSQLWWDIAVQESFRLLEKIYEVPREEFKKNLAFFVEVLELGDLLRLPVRKLSLGQRVRCELAGTLLHNPRVVYLDEPTIGLDVSVKQRIREFLSHVATERRTTVMLTTHDLADIERLAKRIMIIDRGKIIYDGSLSEFKKTFGRRRVVYLDTEGPASLDAAELAAALAIPREALEVRLGEHNGLSVGFDPKETTAKEVIAACLTRLTVRDLTISEPKIESIVRHIYDDRADNYPHAAEPATRTAGRHAGRRRRI